MSELNRNQMQGYARLAGALYLIVIIVGVLGEAAIRTPLVVWGDAAATAQRVLGSQFLWRLGVAAQLLLLVCATGMTFLWYQLLRPVNSKLALLAMFFGVVSLAMESVGALSLHAALTPLTSTALAVLDAQQRHAMSYQAIVAHAQAFGIALIFFGVQCLIVGHLVRNSGYFPKVIGTLLQIAGLCYLINSFSQILFPSLPLFPFILIPSLIGEGACCLWLLFKGVNPTLRDHRLRMGAAV
jgi:hypothetical protein